MIGVITTLARRPPAAGVRIGSVKFTGRTNGQRGRNEVSRVEPTATPVSPFTAPMFVHYPCLLLEHNGPIA